MTSTGPEQRIGSGYAWFAVETDEQRATRRAGGGSDGDRAIAQTAAGWTLYRSEFDRWSDYTGGPLVRIYHPPVAVGTYADLHDAVDRMHQLGYTRDSYRIHDPVGRRVSSAEIADHVRAQAESHRLQRAVEGAS